jgi:hypothetical protein
VSWPIESSPAKPATPDDITRRQREHEFIRHCPSCGNSLFVYMLELL